jgi:hypothetical protein
VRFVNTAAQLMFARFDILFYIQIAIHIVVCALCTLLHAAVWRVYLLYLQQFNDLGNSWSNGR